MAHFELKPDQTIQVARGIARCRATCGQTPVIVSLRMSQRPVDPSVVDLLWTTHGPLWVGTFGYPLDQLPARAELVLSTVDGSEFPPGSRFAVDLAMGDDRVAIEPRDVGGHTEAVLASVAFSPDWVIFTGAAEHGDTVRDSTPAIAAARALMSGHTVAPSLTGAVLVVDGSASMRTPTRLTHLRTLAECVSAVAAEAFGEGRLRLVTVTGLAAEHASAEAMLDVLTSGPAEFGSALDDRATLERLIRPGEAAFVVTDDFPAWLVNDAGPGSLMGRAHGILVGYPAPHPEAVSDVPLSAWSVVSTERRETLTFPMQQLIRLIACTAEGSSS